MEEKQTNRIDDVETDKIIAILKILESTRYNNINLLEVIHTSGVETVREQKLELANKIINSGFFTQSSQNNIFYGSISKLGIKFLNQVRDIHKNKNIDGIGVFRVFNKTSIKLQVFIIILFFLGIYVYKNMNSIEEKKTINLDSIIATTDSAYADSAAAQVVAEAAADSAAALADEAKVAATKNQSSVERIIAQVKENNEFYNAQRVVTLPKNNLLAFRKRFLTSEELKIVNDCKTTTNDGINIFYEDANKPSCIEKKRIDDEISLGSVYDGDTVLYLGLENKFYKIKVLRTGVTGLIAYRLYGKNTLRKIQ